MRAPSIRRPNAVTTLDPRRAARFVGGLAIAAIGMTLMLRTELGAAPWEVFNGGLADLLGLPVALVRYGVVAAIVVAVALLGTRLGAALVLTGFIGATWMAVFDLVVPAVGDGPLRLAVFTAGLIIMGFGVAVYLHADLGAGPHDALIFTAARLSGRPLWLSRMTCEVAALLAGAFLGGALGLGTVAFAIGLGPLISLSTIHLDRWAPIGVDG